MSKTSESGSLKDGLTEKTKITQETPRDEGQGQRPKSKSESVSCHKGKFTIK